MASSNNNQQKGSGADNSDLDKSMTTDASDVDWMIMSDLGTKISGFTASQKPPSKSVAEPSPQPPARSNLDEDIEDIEWLQSIGLDAEIERSPLSTSVENSNDVENIDWLIVSDLQQRLDDTEGESKSKVIPVPQPLTLLQSSLDSLDSSLNGDFSLAELDFSEGLDFSDLEDLGFDSFDNLDSSPLDSSPLDSIDNDNNEQDFSDFSSFLEDNFDPNDLSNDQLNDLENDLEADNQFYEYAENLAEIASEDQLVGQDDQFIDYSGFQPETSSKLEIFSDSFEIETQISAIAAVVEETYLTKEIAEDPSSESLNIQDVFASQEVIPNIDDFDSFDHSFGEIQDINLPDGAGIDDEVWSSPASVIDPQLYEDAFADQWQAEVPNVTDSFEDIDVSDDAIWGGGSEGEINFAENPDWVSESEPVLANLDSNDLDWQESIEAEIAAETTSEIAADYYADELDSDRHAPEWEQVDNITTTLTPTRPNIANEAQQEPLAIGLDVDQFSLEDEFEKAIANDSLEDELGSELEIEESLANELLNGNGLDADFASDFSSDIPALSFDRDASVNSFPTPPVASSYQSPDHDFLDEFDFDDIDTDFDGNEFHSDLAIPAISTGLTPPSPSPAPPLFMLPLPPMRGGNQPKPPSSPSRPLTAPSQVSGGSANSANLGDRNFESFHNESLGSSKFKNNKPISSIDQSWSDLLDADTVLSDVLPAPMDSRQPKAKPHHASEENSRGTSSPRRNQTKLPDFEDLGLEIHNDDDWSGLLENSDMSDSITTISKAGAPLPPRAQQPIARRNDSTSISETREIPRDRRPSMQNFGDANQARMSAPPDQMDFNRFTEERHEPTEPEIPSKPQISLPSISIESLWQNYLKLPALGLGAIGTAVLLYTVMNRPIFELGLRWGIFKDARGLDFTNADFRGAKLDNVDFTKAILTKAKMQDASLEGANFQDANLDGVSFTKAKLNQAKMVGASVIWSDFKDTQMRFVDFSGANLTRSNFSGANLNGASFKGTKIGAPATAEATKLPPINLLAWQIVNQPLEGRNLADKNLSSLNLSFSNLKRANLSRTKLNFTDLAEADLRGANLTGGQIDGANLNGAKLNGINLTGVKFDKSKLPKTDAQTICPNGKNGPCKF